MNKEVIDYGPVGLERVDGEVIGGGDSNGEKMIGVLDDNRKRLDFGEHIGDGAQDVKLYEG